MPSNEYKLFRDVKRAVEGNLLTKRYDEPTYLTFRVIFGEDFASWSGVTLLNTNYDKMPHPLLIQYKWMRHKIEQIIVLNLIEIIIQLLII